jgi:hypothetical protein
MFAARACRICAEALRNEDLFVKALFCFVNPADKPAFDEELLWEQVQDAASAVGDGVWTVERLAAPTETALVQRLADDTWDLLHIVTAAPDRDAHGTVALLSSDKRLRNLSLKYFASIVSGSPSVKLVVLHSGSGAKQSFSNSARELVELGLPVVIAVPALRGRAQHAAFATLFEELSSGASLAAIEERFAALAKQSGHESLNGVEIHAKKRDAPLFPAVAKPKKRTAADSAPAKTAHTASTDDAQPRAEQSPVTEPMPAPLPGGAFLSYCRTDSAFALRLAEDLKASGADVWIDQLDIPPGVAWDRAVEAALSTRPTVLVILSPSSSCSENVLDEVSYAIQKKKRVLPVLYRDCDVPLRLARLQYIDFRFDYDRATKTLLYALGRGTPSSGAA